MSEKLNEKTPVAIIAEGELLSLDCTENVKKYDRVLFSDGMGIRVYRDTLCFMFEVAVNNIFKFRHNIRISNSIGDGYYFVFKDGFLPEDEDVRKISDEMKRLQSSKTKIETLRMTYSNAVKVLEKCRMEQSVSLIRTLVNGSVMLSKACDTYKIAHCVLMDSFEMVQAFELKKYNDGFLLRYPRKGNSEVKNDWHDNPLLFKTLKEDMVNTDTISIDSVGTLNELVSSGNISEYIEVSENMQRRNIIKIADKIKDRGKVRTVFVAGPSSSNKTTFAGKLCMELKVLGFEPLQISLDDYYLTKDKVPHNEFGEPDLECLESIDIGLFQKNLKALYDGKEVSLPHFEFNYGGIGRRTFDPNKIKLKKNNILVVEGIHGLNSKLSGSLDAETIFRIYISPLLQMNLDEYTRIRITDLRIMRRLVRDFRSRGASALETFSMWDSVERGERKYIFPYQNDVDAIINSAHGYEIGVLATYALPLLRTITPEDKIEYYLSAQRLIKILANINPIPASLVPGDSMLHEFIG